MNSKSILKIQRNNRSEIQKKSSEVGEESYGSLAKQRQSDVNYLLNSAKLKNPHVDELIRIKCNDFLTNNISSIGEINKGHKSQIESKK